MLSNQETVDLIVEILRRVAKSNEMKRMLVK